MITIEQQQGQALQDMAQQAIRIARTSRGMTVAQLATAAGVSISTLNNFDAGRSQPSVEILGKIFDALGVSIKLCVE